MPELPTIRRFNSIKNLGVFQRHPSSGGSPEFKEANLIYGFNGTGKTTLTRIFASLEAGVLRPEIPSDAQFQIELSDGTIVKNYDNLSALKGRLLVFNTDFVDANFRWKEGSANPIFYIGAEQTKLSQRLDAVEQSLSATARKLEGLTQASTAAEKSFANYKRDAAREIGEQINQARSYDAASIATDYAHQKYGKEFELSEEHRRQLRQVINADAPPLKLADIEHVPELAPLMSQTRNLLSLTLGELTISELGRHELMLTWVKEGLEYHEANKLKSCLFCGNFLTEKRVNDLKQSLNLKFDELISDIDRNREEADAFRERLNKVKSNLPSKNDFAQEYISRASTAIDDINLCITEGITHIDAVRRSLEKKTKRPNSSIESSDIPYVGNWGREIRRSIGELNSLIKLHNKSHDTFGQSQANSRMTLKKHFLAEGQPYYDELEQAARNARADLKNLQNQASDLAAQSDEIRQNLRKHGPAAAKINELIDCYLGHSTLRIDALKQGEEGYSILRDGKPLAGPLSEGEKTAIAVSYFLSTIEAEGRRLKDLIIVVDDPISSLDTRALNYAFNLIRGALAGASQVIILTHNLYFMNETKKWLKNKAAKGSAALLFLDTIVDAKTNRRSTNIVELPKLIREYESEYHYLFYLVLGFYSEPNTFEGYFYLMPNALRKILDIFFAFKVPGASGLASKLDSAVVKDCGIREDKLRALDRVVQLESHADSLDDLISLSSMALEETRDATSALLALIETLDASHFKQMRSLCS